MRNWLEEVELTGDKVVLAPLRPSHKHALIAAASDGKLWDLWYTWVPSHSDIDDYIAISQSQKGNNTALPFVVLDKSTGKVIGTTRYLNADPENKRLEIGSTWYAKSYQRSGINTECKYLLLRNAFEKLDCIAVEFRTNWFNYASRNAILRLGAKEDGVLRSHKLDRNGVIRDTVVFSILRHEWPTVKKSLRFEINKYRE